MNFFLFLWLCFCCFECRETAVDTDVETVENILLNADTPEIFQVLFDDFPTEEQQDLLENYLCTKFDDHTTYDLEQDSPKIECIKVALHVLHDIYTLDNIFQDCTLAMKSFIEAGNVNMAKTFFDLGFKLSDLFCASNSIKSNRMDMFNLLVTNALGHSSASLQVFKMIKSDEITPTTFDEIFKRKLVSLEIPRACFKGWLEKTLKRDSFDLAHVAYRHGVRFPGHSVKITNARRATLCSLAVRFAGYLSSWEAYKRSYIFNMAFQDANSTIAGTPIEIMQNNIGQWMLTFDDLVSPSDLYQQS